VVAAAQLEPGEGSLCESRAAPVDLVRRADQHEPRVAQSGKAIDAGGAGAEEVEVDAREPARRLRDADQHGWPVDLEQRRYALVVQRDVHDDQTVHERGGRDAADALGPLVAGEQEHVVVEAARRRHRRHHDLHHHRQVEFLAQRHHQRDDVGPAARQGARSGVRPVAQGRDAALDPVPRRRRDRPLPAQRVRHGAQRDARVARDLGESDGT
jgi:hypothetical protein